MSAEIVAMADIRAAKGLPVFHRVDPAELFLPPVGKRVGDRVRTAWGVLGTITEGRREDDGSFTFIVATSRGMERHADRSLEPLA